MRYIKYFENLEIYENTNNNYQPEYLVAELSEKKRNGLINKYAGQIHLLETNNIFGSQVLAQRIKPEKTAVFSFFYGKSEDGLSMEYYTDFGYIYNILYRTNNLKDAINNYEILLKSKSYNL